jgi:hypothetical protein
MELLIAKPLNKDTLIFNGVFEGNKVERVLVTNRCFEELKTYAVTFDSYEMVGTNMVITATNCKEA